ncbi:hypothetical protein SAMN05660991_00521 [Trujillonella endophytica]|uniref:Uncharacterized protein n=1 Tax=Trujillonella endophytica TaxID=673521 RepID=A0A1H8Q1S5_9ACTN|nr:hypothetical protein SAMN05660991_00521 [Trujillella endophytica]
MRGPDTIRLNAAPDGLTPRRAGVASTANPKGAPITNHRGLCADAQLGCPCRGDSARHQERAQQIADARAREGEPAECPECSGPTTPLALATWGNCRVCRTAHTRLTHPLRW